MIKVARYYYWLINGFMVKNRRLIVASFIASFFLIFALINFFPFINSFFFRKKEIIGIVGKFSLKNIPPEIANQISNPLVAVNERGEIIPVLANYWEVGSGNKTYRFHLKKGLYWDDGKQFKASDVAVTFGQIERQVIDDTTVEFKLDQPLSIFPIYLTKSVLKFPLNGIAGLYQVDNYKIKDNKLISISMKPNKNDIPYKNYFFFDSEEDMVAAYKSGKIHLMRTTNTTVVNEFKNWKNTKIEKNVNYNQILTIFFNNQSPFLKTKELRKAFAYATPNFSEYGEPSYSPISPTSWAYSHQIKRYQMDMGKARGLYEKNKETTDSATLNISTFYDYINVSEKVKDSYEKLGIKIDLRVLSYIPDDFDILIALWNPPSDPDQYYYWHSTQKDGNITNYKNVKIDKLLEDGRKIMNIEERRKIYHDFQRVIMDDMPAFYLYHPFIYTITRK